MNDSRQNLWTVIGVLIFVGVCVGLGIYAHSIWVPLLVIAGTVIAFWGASEGTNDHPGRFLILTIVGIGLVAVALWLAQFAGSWLWTPIFLILCLAPFVGGS
jgi:heme/copper-type cytochrome/quinol oxidase subunit 4